MLSLAQCGIGMVSQCRYAARRHSVIHSGSPLRAESARAVASSRPGGSESDSMSVTKTKSERRWRAEHLRQRAAAQGVGDHVVDAAPVGAHAAGLLDAATAGMHAALGHA